VILRTKLHKVYIFLTTQTNKERMDIKANIIFSLKIITLAIGLLSTSGCAVFVSNNIPEAEFSERDVKDEAKVNLTYSVSVQNERDFSDWKTTEAHVSSIAQKYLQESGYFSNVKESRNPGTIHVDFSVTMNPSSNEMLCAFFAGYTLFIIPMWYTHDIELDSEVIVQGQKITSIFEREEVTHAWWLPLLPVGLFKNYMTADTKISRNYFQHLIVELEDKKILPFDSRAISMIPKVQPVPSKPHTGKAKAFGTGFFITPDGHMVTNYHVVKGANRVQVTVDSVKYDAQVVHMDKVNDLALLKVDGSFSYIPIDMTLAPLGREVFTTGFPNPTLMGNKVKYTEGTVSSHYGLKDSAIHYQISVPIQPGNSGGALIDKNTGKAVGVIVSKLSDLYALENSGSIPQNVNYAIKSAYLQAFIAGSPVKLNFSSNNHNVKNNIIENAADSTGMISLY